MPKLEKTFTAVDARGAAYVIVVQTDAVSGAVILRTESGRKVRKLSRGKYLISHVPGEWNDIEVSCDDPSAP